MNRTVEARLKPGVSWRDMHLLSERILLSGLKDLGILKGDVNEMVEKRVGYLFMPHGLGHLIGIDVHDVGGYLKSTPERSTEPGLKNLRTARCMQKHMAITIEPGCYFVDFLLNDGAKLLGIPTSYIDFDKVLVTHTLDTTLHEVGRSEDRGRRGDYRHRNRPAVHRGTLGLIS